MLSGIWRPVRLPFLDLPARPDGRPYGRILSFIRPVALAGVAMVLLFASIDRTQPWSLVTALLGLLLLGAVLTRQMGELLALEERVNLRTDQLAMVSRVVGAVNSGGNFGATLSTMLDQVLPAMRADAGAIWLPAADGSGVALVEQRGLPEVTHAGYLREHLLPECRELNGPATRHAFQIPGRPPGTPPAGCLTVKIGEGDEAGLLFLARWESPFDELEAAVLGVIATDIDVALRGVRMVTEARRQTERDPITNLLNHRSVYKRLHSELERHQSDGLPMAVLMMDLENFKLFNDTYGHAAGDEVLRRVAGVLQRTVPESASIARYGGDEFMVILPATPQKNAVKCAERIQAALGKERFRCEDSSPLPIGFSYGVAVFPDDAPDVQELVATADANLYYSRIQGGGQIVSTSANATDNALVYVKGYDFFRAMVAAIDNKDGYTRKHSEEVTEYSLQIARGMGLGEDWLQTIQIAGILHDVGKIGVPDAILRKPGSLTNEEFDLIKQHPVFGSLIVGAMPGMEEVVHGVRHHHERWDGRGYPDRLAGESIPLLGRIMAVADAFSAMTTHRPYRKGMTEKQALAEVQSGLGTQFDPEIGALFIRLREAQAEPKKPAPRRRRKEETEALAASA